MFALQRGLRKAVVAVTVGTVAILAAACSSSSTSTTTSGAPSTTATTVGLPTATIPTQSTNAAIAATVPASVKSKGTLAVAMDATYAPDEFIAPDGSTIVGMDADLATAITQVLGLKAKLVNATFDTIIPGIQRWSTSSTTSRLARGTTSSRGAR
jgi:polar amino acid transport system substrate-binding protein